MHTVSGQVVVWTLGLGTSSRPWLSHMSRCSRCTEVEIRTYIIALDMSFVPSYTVYTLTDTDPYNSIYPTFITRYTCN